MDTAILLSFAHVWRAGADSKYWRLSMGFALVVAGEGEGDDMVLLQMATRPVLTSASVQETASSRPARHATEENRTKPLKDDFPLPPSFPFLSPGVTKIPGLPFHVFPWSLPSKFDSLSGAPGQVAGKNDRTVQFARNETTVRGPVTDGCLGRVPVGLRGSCSPACFLFSRN